jgi:PAS domain S-box-containing protein
MSRGDRTKNVVSNEVSVSRRKKAEEILENQELSGEPGRTFPDDQALIHELQVHQIELEMQNEELKRARDETEKLQVKYEELYDFAPVGYFTVDQDGTVCEANLTGCRLLGHERQDVIGRRFQAFLPAKSIPVFTAFCRNILETGGKTQADELYLPKAGYRRIYVQISGTELQNRTEEPGRIRMAVSDITERKRLEEALLKERDFAESIIRTAQAIILILDPNGHIVYINPYMEKISGYTLEMVKGKDWFEMFLPAHMKKEVLILFKKAIGGVKTRGYAHSILLKNGRERVIEWYDTTFKGADGSVEGLLAIGQDITAKNKAEEALRKANKKLNLLSGITRHDILNQVAILEGYLDLAGEEIQSPEMRKYLGYLDEAVKTIHHQIEFTKEYQEIGVKAAAWQNVRETVEKACSVFKMENVTLTISCGNIDIYADPLLQKVFYNLFDNAVRYAPPFTAVTITCKEKEEGLSVVFADNGVGITAEDRKHLFERGFGKHTGLGLFLSREILSITGIAITENGTPGTGARFEITVPNGMYRIIK